MLHAWQAANSCFNREGYTGCGGRSSACPGGSWKRWLMVPAQLSLGGRYTGLPLCLQRISCPGHRGGTWTSWVSWRFLWGCRLEMVWMLVCIHRSVHECIFTPLSRLPSSFCVPSLAVPVSLASQSRIYSSVDSEVLLPSSAHPLRHCRAHFETVARRSGHIPAGVG